jgi:PTS system glucitol/sorbitol-specific IIC component
LEALADLSLFSALPVAGVNETLGQWAEDFIGVFQKGAETFVGLVTGIIPLLIILLTAVHALIKMIGPERIDHIGEMAGRPGLRYYPIRYLVLPVLSVFFLTNPMCYTMGRFLPERDKPAFYDSAVSFVHPAAGAVPPRQPRVSCSSGPASRPASPSSACPSATWPSATSTSG